MGPTSAGPMVSMREGLRFKVRTCHPDFSFSSPAFIPSRIPSFLTEMYSFFIPSCIPHRNVSSFHSFLYSFLHKCWEIVLMIASLIFFQIANFAKSNVEFFAAPAAYRTRGHSFIADQDGPLTSPAVTQFRSRAIGYMNSLQRVSFNHCSNILSCMSSAQQTHLLYCFFVYCFICVLMDNQFLVNCLISGNLIIFK